MDIQKLKGLLAVDHPVSGVWAGGNEAAAAQGNTVDMDEPIPMLSGDQLFSATDLTEFGPLSDAKKQMWVSWCGTEHDPHDDVNVAFVKFIFGDTSATIANLNELRKRDVSLFQKEGLGGVKAGDVQKARA